MAIALAQSGFAVYAVDHVAHGLSVGTVYTSTYTTYTSTYTYTNILIYSYTHIHIYREWQEGRDPQQSHYGRRYYMSIYQLNPPLYATNMY
jgi:hypothetical protein